MKNRYLPNLNFVENPYFDRMPLVTTEDFRTELARTEPLEVITSIREQIRAEYDLERDKIMYDTGIAAQQIYMKNVSQEVADRFKKVRVQPTMETISFFGFKKQRSGIEIEIIEKGEERRRWWR